MTTLSEIEAAADALPTAQKQELLLFLTERLRATEGPNRSTPLFAMTGAVHEAAVATYRASGMDGVVAKPLEPHAFYAALQSALARGDAEAGAAAA